jgi:HAE1 family hydrophobic/amphiphilic exporter-1
VVGGLVFAQLVTLYLTPVFYTYMDSVLKWHGSRNRESHAPFVADPASR